MNEEVDCNTIFQLWDQLRKGICGSDRHDEIQENEDYQGTCEQIRGYSYQLLELASDEQVLYQVQEQLDMCTGSCQVYQVEHRLKQVLGSGQNADKAPAYLRERIVTYIRSSTFIREI